MRIRLTRFLLIACLISPLTALPALAAGALPISEAATRPTWLWWAELAGAAGALTGGTWALGRRRYKARAYRRAGERAGMVAQQTRTR